MGATDVGSASVPRNIFPFAASLHHMSRLAIHMPQSVLAILTVTDRPIGVGSLVEVVLCHPQKDARADILISICVISETVGRTPA